MTLEKGDFIIVDYVGKVKETGEVFVTTIEEIAKKQKIYKEGEIFEPKLIVIGEGWVLKALDEAFTGFDIGKSISLEISPDKAFGSRDPEKVKLVPLRRLTNRGLTPQLGMRLEFEGKTAMVRTIGAGRVQLDYNPPLAGKTLVYEVTVHKKLEEKAEKMEALIHRRVQVIEIKKFNRKIRKSEVVIDMPEEAFYLEGIQLTKRGIAADLQRFFPEVTSVKFTETFKKPEPVGVQHQPAPAP